MLVQLKEGGVLRFRCHTGHAYSIRTLLSDVTGYIESSLWNALRAVEEAMLLFEHAARHVQEQPPVDARVYELLEHRARQAHEQADLLREALARHQKAGDTNV